MRRSILVLYLASLLVACDGAAADPDASGVDGGAANADGGRAGDGGGVDSDGGGDRDAGPPGDGGTGSVRCWGFDAPTLVVTRGGPSGDEALLRLELAFMGGASGIVIDDVVQTDATSAEVRRWDVSRLSPPPGFTGDAPTRDGVPEPRVIWTATDAATPSELAVCDGPWTERAGGQVDVTGHTDTGSFAVTCDLNWSARTFDSPLRFACARGVPGYLNEAYDALSDIETPVDWVFAATGGGAYGSSTAPISGLAPTEMEIRSYLDTVFDPQCTAPQESWRPAGGMMKFWTGMTSENTWTGPVAPGALDEDFHYDFQMPGDAPSGFCVPPDLGMPSETCPPPTLQIVLRGTSSAGPWEWESDAFTCLDLTMASP